MNRQALFAWAAGCCMLTVSVVPIRAHHSFAAEFDRDRTITVTGNVQKLEWTNPHARLFVEGADETGKKQVWDFELGPPNGLMRNGWNRNSLQAGHTVTISGFRSKTSAHIANARTVTLADGRQVFAGSSFDTGPAD
jgi:predicted RNA methylase